MDNCVLLHVEDDDGADFLFRLALDEANITAGVYRVLTAEKALQFLRKVNPMNLLVSCIPSSLTDAVRSGAWH
jgi:hypothetical protein